MRKTIEKRYNLSRVLLPIYRALHIIFNNQPLFSKSLHMRMLLLHWEIDSLKTEIGRMKKFVNKEKT